MYRELYPKVAAPKAVAKSVEMPMGLVTNVGQAASGIVSSILTAAAGVSLDSLKPRLYEYFGQNIGLAHYLKGAAIGTIYESIEGVLDSRYRFIVDAIKAGIGQGVGSLHASLFEQTTGTNALMQVYNSILHQVAIAPFVSRWANNEIKPNIPDAETAWFMWKIGVMTKEDYLAYMAQNGWDDKFLWGLEESWASPPPIDMLLELRRRGSITEDNFKDIMRWYRIKPEYIDRAYELFYQVPESYRLALASARGIIDDATYKGAMEWHGLDAYWSDVWREQNYEYPTFSILTELFWRGVISDATFTTWMQRGGLPSDVTEAMKNLREMIPPAGDLVTMVVREAFDPKYVTPAPDVFAEYMAKKGFTKEWSDRYWTMHWVRIPLGQAYANFWRGLWTKEQLLEELRVSDFHPDIRDDIVNVAYNPPSIREMGYGFDTGVYSLDDIWKYRRWGGLSPEDADKSAVAMVAYRTEAEREAVRREHMHLFALDKETREDFEANLRRVWTNEAAIPLWIERGELEHERLAKEAAMPEPRIISSSEALYAFRNRLRDEDWTYKSLLDLGWTPERATLAIERVRHEWTQDVIEEETKEAKKLTITQLSNLYKFGRINREQLVFGLALLKYNEGDAYLLADDIIADVEAELAPRRLSISEVNRLYEYSLLGMPMSDIKTTVHTIITGEVPYSPTKELLNYYVNSNYSDDDSYRLVLWTIIDLNLSRLRAMYSKGWIDSTTFMTELSNLGIPYDVAQYIGMAVIKAEQPARTTTEKDLTKSEIIKGVKAGVLTVQQGSELLQSIGYDENEAMYLLYINAVVARSDPETYWEMRKVTEQYKKAMGEPSVEIPDELITLDLQLREAKVKLEKLKAEKAPEEEIGEVSVSIAGIQSAMRTIIAKLKIQ